MTTPARDTVRSNYARMEAAVEPTLMDLVRAYGREKHHQGAILARLGRGGTIDESNAQDARVDAALIAVLTAVAEIVREDS